MVGESYIPDRGDLVWLQFNPQSGREQAGKRPAITLSPKTYNAKVGLGLFCPVSSKVKGYPFEVVIQGRAIDGVVLSDQIKCLDWRRRDARFIEKANDRTIEEVVIKIKAIIGRPEQVA